MNSLLRALRAIYNISSDEGEEFFADELLVYYEWKANTKWRSRQTKSSKDNSRTALNGEHKILSTRVYSPFTLVVYFVKVWLFY